MKILTVSDYVINNLYDRLSHQLESGIDLIISCGDLAPEYLSYLSSSFKAPLYYISGNHDIRYQNKPPEGCMDIHCQLVQFDQLKILGLEGSRWYNGGPYQYTEKQMKGFIRKLRPKIWWKGGVDIIVTHAPPRHINDQEDRCHRGFKSYRWLIDHYNPKLFIHGHIHRLFIKDSQRITSVNTTKVINTYGYYLCDINYEKSTKKASA